MADVDQLFDCQTARRRRLSCDGANVESRGASNKDCEDEHALHGRSHLVAQAVRPCFAGRWAALKGCATNRSRKLTPGTVNPTFRNRPNPGRVRQHKPARRSWAFDTVFSESPH